MVILITIKLIFHFGYSYYFKEDTTQVLVIVITLKVILTLLF